MVAIVGGVFSTQLHIEIVCDHIQEFQKSDYAGTQNETHQSTDFTCGVRAEQSAYYIKYSFDVSWRYSLNKAGYS